ncbi:alpha-galactosidase [Streptosporangium sp. CA-135522]|uniref:alpha-galactosidase n=1 Tax=Streptosporangium sp. CA-135522 TaxID=3240072 RepID=UPI003D8F9684
MIFFDPAAKLWLLTTPSSSYALRLDEGDAPRHVHWGAPLTLEQAVGISARHPGDDDPGGEELAVEGGLRFGTPSLTVRYGDGTRGVEWRHLGHRIDDGELRIDFADRSRELRLTLHYRVFGDCDVIERWATVRAVEPVEILRFDSAQWTLPHLRDYRASHVVGEWGREFQLRRLGVPVGETVFTSRHGVTGHHANPWLMADDGQATEEHGEVWSAALAWSGSWRITLHRDPRGRAGWTGGFGHEGLTWRLGAGEELTTPVFAGLYARDGFGGTSRAWHSYVASHVLPAPAEVRPVIFNSWEATEFDISQDQQVELAERAARLGAELFVVDDAWFGARTSDAAGLGDWWPNPDRFPEGLGPLIAKVRGLGMKFGLWVEPEAVNPDSDLYRAHPDWVLHQTDRTRTTSRNQLVLNLARSDVAEWTHTWLDRLLTEYDIAFLKWDMNRSFSEAGQPGHPDPERLWIDHVRNVHGILDRLRADHPGLLIEGCAGGGGRTDLGMLRHVDQLWTSDNTDAAERVAIQHGFGQIYPVRAMGAWVTDSPNAMTARCAPLRYRFHVAMAGALGIGGDLRGWTEEEMTWAAGLVEQYKKIRPIVHGGAQYRLSPPEAGTAAVQYVSADASETVVFLFQPSSLPRGGAPIRLAALDPAARYRDEATGAVHHGAVLLSHGLPPLLTFDTTSELVHLRRLA